MASVGPLGRTVLTLATLVSGCGLPWSGEVLVAEEAAASDAGLADVDAAPRLDAGPTLDAGPPDLGVARPNLAVEAMQALPISMVPGTGATARVRVRAAGPAPTPANELRLELVPKRPGTPAVRIGAAPVPALSAGEAVDVTVEIWVPSGALEQSYTPQATVDPDQTLEESNEADNRAQSRPLWVSALEVQPSALDFGAIGVGCLASDEVVLTNRSQSASFVSSARVAEGPFELLAPSLPARLDSGAQLRLPIRYQPVASGLHFATLALEHDRVLGTVTVPLAGAAAIDPARTDHFTTWARPRVDVLVVVDDSPTMQEEQARLQISSAALLRDLESRFIDYHVGVTTTDMTVTGPRGALRGRTPVLRPDAPAAGHDLGLALRVGTTGSELERGLEAARAALSTDLNPGFRRAEAALWILFFSDEDDRSAGAVEAHLAALVAAAGPRAREGLFVSAVTAPPTPTCATTTSPGVRYQALAAEVGGETRDICRFAWDEDLPAALPEGFGAQHRFELRYAPEAGSVRVFVDGVPHPDGWRRDGRTIEFEPGAPPAPGAAVRVEYRTRC